jgi:tetratricopeptide (TPR) repeat protein
MFRCVTCWRAADRLKRVLALARTQAALRRGLRGRFSNLRAGWKTCPTLKIDHGRRSMERHSPGRDRGGLRRRGAALLACLALLLIVQPWLASPSREREPGFSDAARSYRLTNHHDPGVVPASTAFAPPPLPVVTAAARRKIEHYKEELPTTTAEPPASGDSASLSSPRLPSSPRVNEDRGHAELPYGDILSETSAALPVRPMISSAAPRPPVERRVTFSPPIVEARPAAQFEPNLPLATADAPARAWEPPVAPPLYHAAPDRTMQAISVRVDQGNRRGFELASKGALYTARAEFLKALRLVAHALDAQDGTSRHADALADGWLALEEADDFIDRGLAVDRRIDVRAAIAAHRTVVLKEAPDTDLTPLVALTRYYSYAQEQLAAAVHREPTGSVALYGLGKVHATLAAADAATTVAGAPKAIALYQAALAVDSANALAAHELGVLLARCGQFDAARAALAHSASRGSHPETWRSLAFVLEQLGDHRAAAQARHTASSAGQIRRPSGTTGSPQQPLVWMEASQFANTSVAQADVTAAPRPPVSAAAPTPGQLPVGAAKSAWPWPIRLGVNTK